MSMEFASVELREEGPVYVVEPLVPHREEGAYLRIAVLLAGLCHSDIREVRRTRDLRRDFGHELVGVIVEASESLRDLLEQRVSFNPNIGIKKTTGFSQKVLATGNPMDLRAAFPVIPPSIPNDLAVMIEPLACASHCVGRFMAETRVAKTHLERVVVQGAGTFGILILRILKHYGFNAFLQNRTTERIQFLTKLGMLSEDEFAGIFPCWSASNSSGPPYDAAIIATSECRPEIVAKVTGQVKPGGLLLLFGGTRPGTEFHLGALDLDSIRRAEQCKTFPLQGKEITVSGSYGAEACDFRVSMTLLESGLNIAPLLVGRMALKDLPSRLVRYAAGEVYRGRLIIDIA